MEWGAPSVVDALAGESRRAAEVALALSEDAFTRPTRCPPWDVKALVGHLYRDVDRILEYRDRLAGAPDTDSVSYWTSYDPRGDAADVSARAQQIADGYATGSDLARAFDERWRVAVAAAQEMSPDRSISTFGPTLRFDEYVKTRVLEMAVHGLDLAHALDREPWTMPEAAAVVHAILVGLLGIEPPAALGWDDVTFFDTGTGRRALTDAERSALGERAGRFPLLS